MKPVVWLSALLCGWSAWLPVKGQQPFRVMFYNVENLFDCRHDSLKEDREFLPDGEKKWTPSRYWRKLDALSKVVVAVGEERLPDLVGLCEVENDSVLFDLTRRSSLRALGYRYVATHSPDVRGIDVALLYQPGSFRLLESHEIPVPSAEAGFRPTRNVLYVKGEVLSGDTLHVLGCHLPSRLGATRVSRRHRMLAARTVRAVADSVHTATSDARILWMGDFNADVEDRVFREVVFPYFREPGLSPFCADGVKGSYRYRGIWETIDHILVSPVLMDNSRPFHTSDGCRAIVAFPFMCEREKTYGGVRPFRTYQGPLYKGGYSDHFPVTLDFEWRFPE